MTEIEAIKDLAEKLVTLRETKKELEQHLKDLNKEIIDVEEHKLNDLLNNQGISKLQTDGLEISKSTVFRCPYTKSDNKEAFQFLFDSDNDGALKKVIIINEEDDPFAEAVLQQNNIIYRKEYSIHHATLSSVIKQLVSENKFSIEDIDKYNIYIQPQIKIKKIGGKSND